MKSKERFPNSTKNLIAIKETLNDEKLNQYFDSIKQSKRFYCGAIIALGRDLSDDVMDYIVSKGKEIGRILSKFTNDEIKSFIQTAAPERIIKTISITEEMNHTDIIDEKARNIIQERVKKGMIGPGSDTWGFQIRKKLFLTILCKDILVELFFQKKPPVEQLKKKKIQMRKVKH